MSKASIEKAKQAGLKDGAEAVIVFFDENGIDALRDARKPGKGNWSEPAAAAGVAQISLKRRVLSAATKLAYYAAYDEAADKTAESLLQEAIEDGR